jgi:hypothetical protein
MRYTTEMNAASGMPTPAAMPNTAVATALFRSGVRCGRKSGRENCDYNTEIPFRHDNPIHLPNPDQRSDR